MFSPETARRLDVNNEDTVELKYEGRTIRAPAWVMPGHADESVSVFLGYGRTRSGRVGHGRRFRCGLDTSAEYAVVWLRALSSAKLARTGRWPPPSTTTPWKGATW